MSRTAVLQRLALTGLWVATTIVQTDAPCDRACLTGVADAYFAALVVHSPSKAPMAPAATAGPRPANAAPAAGGGALPGATGPAQLCGPQLTTRVMSYIDSIDLRRVRIADPETGLVFGLSMFRHSMTNKTVTVVNPDGTRREREMNFQPFDLEAGHIFKVQGNKIHEIEAMGFRLPLYSKNGWGEFTR